MKSTVARSVTAPKITDKWERGDFTNLYDIIAAAAPKTKATRPNMPCTSKEIFNETTAETTAPNH